MISVKKALQHFKDHHRPAVVSGADACSEKSSKPRRKGQAVNALCQMTGLGLTKIQKVFGKIDILFANAGVAKFAPIGDTDETAVLRPSGGNPPPTDFIPIASASMGCSGRLTDSAE